MSLLTDGSSNDAISKLEVLMKTGKAGIFYLEYRLRCQHWTQQNGSVGKGVLCAMIPGETRTNICSP